MSKKTETFYVTTPIYYGTAKPHLGSLYSTLLADTLSRFNKMKGKEVFFLTGTDEHGQKVAQAAEKAGKVPQEFVNDFINDYKLVWKKYSIDYSRFIRTTDVEHKKAVQEWIEQLKAKGDIYKGHYVGWYCISCETFVVEATDSEKPVPCADCNRTCSLVEEESYFFKLSSYQDKLLEFYKNNPNFVMPKERLNEVISFVKSGLKDLSISRTTISWGIPFKNDPEHLVYVWADALNNYITALGWPNDKDNVQHWWPANVQVLGKDIVRFHAVFWPAFLMAIDLEMPKKLLVHGWIKINKEKMSKSFGNVVDPVELEKEYGADEVRYYLLKQIAITHDSEFSIQDLKEHITRDLANDLGNLLNRLLILSSKNNCIYFDNDCVWLQAEIDLQKAEKAVFEAIDKYMQDGMFHMMLAEIWRYIKLVNGYFHNQEPWKLVKTDLKAFIRVLAATRNALHAIGYFLLPVMPNKMEKLLSAIGVINIKNAAVFADLKKIWQKNKYELKSIEPLFKKLEIKENIMTKEAEVSKKEEKFIGIEDVIKVHLAVGTIIACEIVESSTKLLKMQVDLGDLGKRQILAGLRASFSPEDLVGKQGTFIVNLKPRKMAGFESEGMMLVAKGKEGKACLMSPSDDVLEGVRLQ